MTLPTLQVFYLGYFLFFFFDNVVNDFIYIKNIFYAYNINKNLQKNNNLY